MKNFWREWREGFSILLSVLVVGGLCLLSGGLVGRCWPLSW
jgi:hypothetical protein